MKPKTEILAMNKEDLLEYKWHDDLDRKASDTTNRDCFGCSYCSDCSDCSYCSHCFGCSYCSDCSYCSNCSNCSGCSYCYACRNLSDAEYCICNIQLTKEEYEKKMKELKQ